MSKGKAVAQASHASVGALGKANRRAVASWKRTGQKKVAVAVSREREIKDLAAKCKKLRIAHFLVADAGLTELASGTITALGIGPDKEEKIDKVTGCLPLLK